MLPIQPGTQFPISLTIENIPYTIMHEYPTDEKRDLFGGDNEEITPTINRLNDNPV